MDAQIKNNTMKTNYGTLTEYLTLLIMEQKLTTAEAATILRAVALISNDEYNKGYEDGNHDLYSESKREDLEAESKNEVYDNVTINGDESIDELKKAV